MSYRHSRRLDLNRLTVKAIVRKPLSNWFLVPIMLVVVVLTDLKIRSSVKRVASTSYVTPLNRRLSLHFVHNIQLSVLNHQLIQYRRQFSLTPLRINVT